MQKEKLLKENSMNNIFGNRYIDLNQQYKNK